MLDIRAELKAALGASFIVVHQGNNVTVNVGDAGRGDELALPAVFIISQFGASEPSNIGGGGVENVTRCDLSIQTQDADTWDGPLLTKEIHSKLETLIRAVEKTLGGSYLSLVTSWRDDPPRAFGSYHVYVRTVTVQAQNIESY